MIGQATLKDIVAPGFSLASGVVNHSCMYAFSESNIISIGPIVSVTRNSGDTRRRYTTTARDMSFSSV